MKVEVGVDLLLAVIVVRAILEVDHIVAVAVALGHHVTDTTIIAIQGAVLLEDGGRVAEVEVRSSQRKKLQIPSLELSLPRSKGKESNLNHIS